MIPRQGVFFLGRFEHSGLVVSRHAYCTIVIASTGMSFDVMSEHAEEVVANEEQDHQKDVCDKRAGITHWCTE